MLDTKKPVITAAGFAARILTDSHPNVEFPIRAEIIRHDAGGTMRNEFSFTPDGYFFRKRKSDGIQPISEFDLRNVPQCYNNSKSIGPKPEPVLLSPEDCCCAESQTPALNWHKPLETEDGRKVRLLGNRLHHSHPMVCAVLERDPKGEYEMVRSYSPIGTAMSGSAKRDNLRNAKKKRTVTFWLNGYTDHVGFHEDKDRALKNAQNARNNCGLIEAAKEVTITFEEK